MTEAEILRFINNNFKDNRKSLFPSINSFILNPVSTNVLNESFLNVLNETFWVESYSSKSRRSSKTKRNEVGDISDVWTFCLNADIKNNVSNDDFDRDFTDYLKAGNELHLCRLWTNWFLPVFYLETTYEIFDNKKKVSQFGPVMLYDKQEIRTVNQIIEILTNTHYQRLDSDFLSKKIKGISTDCSEKKNATIFECLFSDLCLPTRHIRQSILFKNKLHKGKPKLSFKEYLDNNREVLFMEAEISQSAYSPLTIIFDKYNKIIETESRGKLNGKPYSVIKIKYE